MKVQDTNLAGTSAAAAPPAGAVTRSAGLTSPPVGTASNSDHVEFSGFAGKLGVMLAAQSQDRATRVEALEHDYQSGGYSVDAQQTARALIQETLGVTAGDKGA